MHADIPEGYISGLGRDTTPPRVAHLYRGDFAEPGLPLCWRGWNRDGGESYSIWRGNVGVDGVCGHCLRRAAQGLDGVAPRPHATPDGVGPYRPGEDDGAEEEGTDGDA